MREVLRTNGAGPGMGMGAILGRVVLTVADVLIWGMAAGVTSRAVGESGVGRCMFGCRSAGCGRWWVANGWGLG